MKIEFKLIIFLGFYFLISPFGWADLIKSTLYDPESKRQKVLFRAERTEEQKNGKRITKTRFLDSEGQEALTEEVVLHQGQFESITVDQKQLNQKLSAYLKEGKLIYHVTQNGKTETEGEDFKSEMIVGPLVSQLIQNHWDELIGGESVSFRIIVLDRKETVGFKVFKSKKQFENDAVSFEMKPTSFIISALVKPIRLNFNKTSKKIVSVFGRVLPKINRGGKWLDTEAEWVFEQN